MSETQKYDKQNPMRSWLERHLGKVILASIPVVLTMLAGWIYTIGNDMAVLKQKVSENDAQWKVLYENRQQLQALTVEVEVYKKLFSMLLDRNKIEVGRLTLPEKSGLETSGKSEPPQTYDRKVEEFRHEQLQQMKH
jgi:hypothetical protein